MTNRAIISSPNAPAAIGPYSQAVKVGNTVWLSGQIPLVPDTMELVTGDIQAQARQVFSNLAAVAEAARRAIARLSAFFTPGRIDAARKERARA